MSSPDPSVQLYSVRDALAADLPGTLDRLAAIGFTRVEPFGLDRFAAQLARELPARGLEAPTAHVSFLQNGAVDAAIDAAATAGVRTIIDPHIPAEAWTSEGDVERIADLLNAAAARAAQSGIEVGYHNHAWEPGTVFDGTTALEILARQLDPAVRLEVDTYWAEVGGVSAVDLLGRLGDRVVAIHVKDGYRDGDVARQRPAGAGEIPVAEILAAAPRALHVIEFDDYAGDIFQGLAQSHVFVTAQGAHE